MTGGNLIEKNFFGDLCEFSSATAVFKFRDTNKNTLELKEFSF